MNKPSIKFLFSLVFAFFLVAPLVVAQVSAQATPPDAYGLETTANTAGVKPTGTGQPTTLQGYIGQATGAVLSLVGVAFFILTLYGGFLWMTARGDEARAKKALGVIIDAGIGLVIVSAAYIITKFVFNAIGRT